MRETFPRNKQYYKFSLYGFLKNLKFFDPFILLFFREMGFSFLEIGTLFSIREIMTNILEIPTGVVADTYGRRRSMVYAFLSYIFSFLIFYFFPYFGLYALAMVLFASGEAFRTGTHKAMILEHLKLHRLLDHRVDYYGHTRAWAQFGSAVSSLIAAALVFYSGSYRIIFVASVVPYIMGLALMISYPEELDGEREKLDGSAVQERSKKQIAVTVKGFVSLFRSKGVLKALIHSSMFDAVFKTVKDYLQPVVKQYALFLPLFIRMTSEKRVSILIGVVYFLLFLLTSIASGSSDTIHRKMSSLTQAINLTFLLGALLVVATGALITARLFIPAIVLFVLYYMLENIKRPMTLGYVSELISSRVMATGLSGESQLKTIFVALLAPLMGLAADHLGVGAGILLISLLLIGAFPFVMVTQRGTQEDI